MEIPRFMLVRLHHHEIATSCYSRKIYRLGRDLVRKSGLQELANGINLLNCKSQNVSRNHAEISCGDEGIWKIQDMGSSNGTFLNNRKLSEGLQRELRDGDIIGLGFPGIGLYDPEELEAAAKNPHCFLFKYIEIANDYHNRSIDVAVNYDAETVVGFVNVPGLSSSRSRNNPPNNIQRPLPPLFASTEVSTSQRLKQETCGNKRPCVNDDASSKDDSSDDSSDGLPGENIHSSIKMANSTSNSLITTKKPKLATHSRDGKLGINEKPKRNTVSTSTEDRSTCSSTSKNPPDKKQMVQEEVLDSSQSDDDGRSSDCSGDDDRSITSSILLDEDDDDTSKKDSKNDKESDNDSAEKLNSDSDSDSNVNDIKTEFDKNANKRETEGGTEEFSDNDSDIIYLESVFVNKGADKTKELRDGSTKTENSEAGVGESSSRITRKNISTGHESPSKITTVEYSKITTENKEGHPNEDGKSTPTISNGNLSDGNKPKTYKNVNIRNDFDRRRSKSQEGPFLNLDTIYKDICKWNVSWLEQRKHPTKPPALEAEKHYRPALEIEPVRSNYENYEAYQRVFYPLLLHEIWTSVYNDMLNYEKLPDYATKVYVNDCNVVEDCPLTPSIEPSIRSRDRWANMRCHTLVNNGKDILTQLDLCLFEYSLKIADGSYKNRITFAFILKSSQSLQEIDGQKFNSFNVVFHIKSGEHDVSHNKSNSKCKIRRLSSIADNIRNYNSFITLPKTPLCETILNPTRVENSWSHDPRIRSYPSLRSHCKPLDPRQQSIVHYTTRRIMQNREEPDVMLIQGQPGTGKTKTVAAIVMQLVTSYEFKNQEPNILVCAPSDRALDEIVFHLHEILRPMQYDHRPRMVRIDGGDSISEISRQYTPEYLAKNQISKNAVLDPSANKTADQDEIGRITNDIIKSSRIVCCTLALSSSSESNLRKYFQVFDSPQSSLPKFSCCIIDEAAQANEIESLAPLVFNFNKLIMVGDPFLLDAKVVSPTSWKKGFGQSLFRRLHGYHSKQSQFSVLTLQTQYRMHEQILKWPNASYYNGTRALLPVLKNPVLCPLPPYIFLNCTFEESGTNGNLINETELILITKMLLSFWNGLNFLKHKYSFGVIGPTPEFNTQLRELIKQKVQRLENVEVDVLENFQGREKDIMVLACMSSKSTKIVYGNKLNLALTRAKLSMWIVGNEKNLETDSRWKSLIEDAKDRKVVHEILSSRIKDPVYVKDRLSLIGSKYSDAQW